ncbi:MAG: c-type cytochrome [Planctomycetes bacterium]|nr:c-type cytochrome [Planctomycetota bacterium]
MRKPILFTATLAALALVGCGESEKSSRGIDYMPEMYNHPGYESQTAREVVDGKTVRHVPMMLPMIDGTVSRDGAAYDVAPLDAAAAKNLVNPQPATAAVLKRGQQLYNSTCAMCHGRDGDAANGYVVATSKHPNRFASVQSVSTANVALMSDGEIYHIISRGRNRMTDLSAQLLPADRWAVVLYTKALARATQTIGDAEVQLAKLEKESQQAIKDNNPYDKAALDAARALVAQRKVDLLLIQQGGDGDEFIPPKKPVPEYVKPSWKAEK